MMLPDVMEMKWLENKRANASCIVVNRNIFPQKPFYTLVTDYSFQNARGEKKKKGMLNYKPNTYILQKKSPNHPKHIIFEDVGCT